MARTSRPCLSAFELNRRPACPAVVRRSPDRALDPTEGLLSAYRRHASIHRSYPASYHYRNPMSNGKCWRWCRIGVPCLVVSAVAALAERGSFICPICPIRPIPPVLCDGLLTAHLNRPQVSSPSFVVPPPCCGGGCLLRLPRRLSGLVNKSRPSYTPTMAKKVTAPASKVVRGSPDPAQKSTVGLPKPSSLVDTRVIYCGDNLEQLEEIARRLCGFDLH